jgi:hypothetical protein
MASNDPRRQLRTGGDRGRMDGPPGWADSLFVGRSRADKEADQDAMLRVLLVLGGVAAVLLVGLHAAAKPSPGVRPAPALRSSWRFLSSLWTDFALATVPTGPDEAREPPPTNFYALRDNLGGVAIGTSDVALLVAGWRGGRRPRSRLGGSRRSRR